MNALWITNDKFQNLTPLNVFHKEMKKIELIHDTNLSNSHILFRRKLLLKSTENISIKISADDYYKLYINGTFVTMGPASAYNFNYYFNEIDVSNYLVLGENTIAVHTYYQGLTNRVWVSSDNRHGFIFEMQQNNKILLQSDESWKTNEHNGFSSCGIIGYDTAFAEIYDANSRELGFESPNFDDSYWKNAKFKQNVDYTLVIQPTRLLDIYDIVPKKIIKTDFGYSIDFGFEAVGYLKFRALGRNNDKITIHCAEELTNEGLCRFEMRCNCKYEEFFVLSGKGYDEYNNFDYKAFRFVDLIFPKNCEIDTDSIKFSVRHYPFSENAKCRYDDDSLKMIWRLCSDTVKYGVQECYVDCPTREKGQYLGDVTIVAMVHSVLTNNADMMKKALENYMQSSFICKGLMSVAPASLMQEIADYSLQFPMQILWYFNFTNDIEFLKSSYPYVLNVLKYFETYEREDGLLHNVREKWNLVDWPSNLRDGYDFTIDRPIKDGTHNVINAFYCGMISHIDKISEILGKEKTGKKNKIYNAYKAAFYNEKTHLYLDCEDTTHSSLHSNALALLFDIHIDDDTKLAIINMIKEKKLTCSGTYMAYFVLSALKRVGEEDLIKELILDPNAWLNMINEGATTCFEAWGKEQKWNTSLFHPWSSCPILFLKR